MRLPFVGGRSRRWLASAIALLLGSRLAAAIALDPTDVESVKRAAKIAARDLIQYYHGDDYGAVPGLLAYPPYFWWESGSMWMTLIEYYWATGDDQYNELITQGLQFQTGPDRNFINANQSFDNGNDDQAFWAFAAMDAAELRFPNPPKSDPQWLALGQAVFNVQLTRFTDTCGGGLPWQVYETTPGYNYKNTISNGCFFALAARLARYTGNDTYAHYAVTTYDWMHSVGLVDEYYRIWDGTDVLENCSSVNGIRWTYNAGVLLLGAATMWNHTKDAIWKERVNGIVDQLPYFFIDDVMWEPYCEGNTLHPCNVDQQSFKAYLARWMVVCAQLAPWTYDRIIPLLQTSAKAAAEQCTGGTTGTQCGSRWTINGTTGQSDGLIGAGEQISAVSIFSTLMVPLMMAEAGDGKFSAPLAPVTHKDGISPGDPGAGLGGNSLDPLSEVNDLHITTAGRAGAWILTVLFALLTLGGALWAVWDDGKPFSYVDAALSRGKALTSKTPASKTPTSKTPASKSPSSKSPISKTPTEKGNEKAATGMISPGRMRQPPPSPA